MLVNHLQVNIAYMKIWVHLTFVLVHLRKKKLGAPVQPVLKVSLEPWGIVIKYFFNVLIVKLNQIKFV